MSMQMDSESDDGLVNDINMTPLIDVMLVLLIIFIVTLPVINQAVKVKLPKASAEPVSQKSNDVDVSIMADGQILWNKNPVDDATLGRDIAEAAQQQPTPAVSIFADKYVEYDHVARVLASLQGGGLAKINFVTARADDK